MEVTDKNGQYRHKTRCKNMKTCTECGKRMQARNFQKHMEENCPAKFGSARKKRRIYSLADKLEMALEYEIWSADRLSIKLFLKKHGIDNRQLKGVFSLNTFNKNPHCIK